MAHPFERAAKNAQKNSITFPLVRLFRVIGGGARDQVATDSIMGHAREDMASVYRERVEDERLRAVTDHVHDWLFPPAEKGKRKASKREPASNRA